MSKIEQAAIIEECAKAARSKALQVEYPRTDWGDGFLAGAKAAEEAIRSLNGEALHTELTEADEIERLKRKYADYREDAKAQHKVAADEITRLRAENERLRNAAEALYFAGVWHCDREVDEAALWVEMRDALSLEEGSATKAGVAGNRYSGQRTNPRSRTVHRNTESEG